MDGCLKISEIGSNVRVNWTNFIVDMLKVLCMENENINEER